MKQNRSPETEPCVYGYLKLVLEKAEEPEIKLPTSAGSSKKEESSRKTSISALLTMPKPLICMQVKKQQIELEMEKQTGFKSGKEYVKTIYCHPAFSTYMQSTS